MKRFIALLAMAIICAQAAYAAKSVNAIVTGVRGKAYVKTDEKGAWKKCYNTMVLKENAVIKTEPRSKAEIILNDRSRIQLKSNSQIKLDSISGNDKVVEQQKGKSVFRISKFIQNRKFRCKTPVAVCSVRGTEFAVEVGDNNESTFKVFSGLVDVSGPGGVGSVLLNPNEKINVLENMPLGAPSRFTASDSQEKAAVNRQSIVQNVGLEVSAELSKEAVQKAAADEMRLAEYQNGKTIVDAFGQRVRIEEYLIRTAANQFKLVALNEREERFDYFTNIQTFNTNLPSDLSVATKYWREWQNGAKTTNPAYYLTGNESGASNTADVVLWGYTGGHLVANGSTYNHLYDNYYFTINNISKMSYQPTSGTGIASMNDVTWTVAGVGVMNNNSFLAWWTANVVSSTPDGSDKMRIRLNTTFGDGSTYQEEYFTINDFGKVASLSDYMANGKLAYNQEMVLSGSDFVGKDKKIDLCVEPRIFIDAGLASE